jgi:hypothetical protein
MKDVLKHTKTLLRSLVVSKGAVVGGVKNAEEIIYNAMVKVSEFTPAEASILVDGDHLDTPIGDISVAGIVEESMSIQNIPENLLFLAKEELKDGMPSKSEIKNLFLYGLDLSGITFYESKSGVLTFGKIVRSLDLSSGEDYHNNKQEAYAYTQALRSKNEFLIEQAAKELKALLPSKKLKYLHWIGEKPDKLEIESYKEENPEYFQCVSYEDATS